MKKYAKNDFEKFFKLCSKIGLKTNADVLLFKNKEKQENETLLEALERYANLLGENFKIVEDLA